MIGQISQTEYYLALALSCYLQKVPSQRGGGRLLGASAVFLYKNGRYSETKSRKIDPKV